MKTQTQFSLLEFIIGFMEYAEAKQRITSFPLFSDPAWHELLWRLRNDYTLSGHLRDGFAWDEQHPKSRALLEITAGLNAWVVDRCDAADGRIMLRYHPQRGSLFCREHPELAQVAFEIAKKIPDFF